MTSPGLADPEVLMDSGDVYGLGENWYGQLGIGSKERRPRSRLVLPKCNGTFMEFPQ